MIGLRDELRASLDLIVAAPGTVERAMAAGRRSKRRRTIAVTVAGVLLFTGGATALVQHGSEPAVLRPAGADDQTIPTPMSVAEVAAALASGDEAEVRSRFTRQLRDQLSERGLRQLWSSVVEDIGGYVGSSDTGAVPDDPYNQVKLDGKRTYGYLTVTRDDAGMLTSLFAHDAEMTGGARYVALLFAEGDFTAYPEINQLFTEQQLRRTWQAMLDDSGAVVRVGPRADRNAPDVVRLTLDRGTADLTLIHDREGVVTGMTLRTNA